MTDNVFGGTLNLAQSINVWHEFSCNLTVLPTHRAFIC